MQLKVFPGRHDYQPPLRREISVHSSTEGMLREEWAQFVGPNMSCVIFNSSYMTPVWQVSCQLGMRKRCYCTRVKSQRKVYLQRSTELIGQQGKFPVLSLVCRNCVVLDLLYSSLLYSSGFAVIVTKSDTNYNYALSSCSSSWCAFRSDN